jgi:two-component system cell cycle sensor histidine kinase/response regulator CckA
MSNADNEGNRFSVVFPPVMQKPFVPDAGYGPQVPVARTPRVEPSGAYAKNATGWETVLLVDDDDSVRGVIRRVLEKHGYHVIEAHDGVEALEVVAANIGNVHLILSDVVMPRMSGRVLLDRLAELEVQPKVLMMSGHPDEDLELNGAFPPGTPFIAKPFSIATVTRRMRDVLDGKL